MNWNDAGIIFQIVGSLAVVLSLVYLAKQVRDGTKNLKTSMRDSSFHNLMEWNYYVMSDSELAWIFQQGCKDFYSLTEIQKPRYIHAMFSFFKVFENIYLHYMDKAVADYVWESNRKVLSAYVLTPGAKLYWNQRKPAFDPTFQSYIDKITDSEVPAGHVISEDRPGGEAKTNN